MRKELKKLKTVTVFTAKIEGVRYQRLLLKNVIIYGVDGCTPIGKVHHVLVAKKPFTDYPIGSEVRFTGVPHKYERQNHTIDYSIKINKVKGLI